MGVYHNGLTLQAPTPTKWSNTLKQFVGNLPTNCSNVSDHFVGLALKRLKCYNRNRKVPGSNSHMFSAEIWNLISLRGSR